MNLIVGVEKKKRGHSRQRKLQMQREVKEPASFRDKWVPEAGALGVSAGQGRYEGDKVGY